MKYNFKQISFKPQSDTVWHVFQIRLESQFNIATHADMMVMFSLITCAVDSPSFRSLLRNKSSCQPVSDHFFLALLFLLSRSLTLTERSLQCCVIAEERSGCSCHHYSIRNRTFLLICISQNKVQLPWVALINLGCIGVLAKWNLQGSILFLPLNCFQDVITLTKHTCVTLTWFCQAD